MSMFIKEKPQQSATTTTTTTTHQVKVEEQLFPNNNNMVFEEEEKKQKKAGSSSSSTGRKSGGGGGGGGGGGWGGGIGVCCQADLCGVDLTESKRYHRRHKVCEIHAKAPSVLISGLTQRFCQQCSRFHELTEFDDAKRSCRRRLAGHNERRRKASSLEPHKEAASGTSSSSRTKAATANATATAANPQCRPADQMSTAHPASTTTPTNYKPYEIR